MITVATDGLYLILQKAEGDCFWVAVRGADHGELLQRAPLMPFEVTSAEAMLHEKGSIPMVSVRLAGALREAFARVTERYKGRRLAVVVGGIVVVAPRINEPIQTEILQIVGGRDLAAAKELAALLRSASG